MYLPTIKSKTQRNVCCALCNVENRRKTGAFDVFLMVFFVFTKQSLDIFNADSSTIVLEKWITLYYATKSKEVKACVCLIEEVVSPRAKLSGIFQFI